MHFLVLSNSTHCFTSSVELPSWSSVSCNQTFVIASPPCYQMPYQASLLSLVFRHPSGSLLLNQLRTPAPGLLQSSHLLMSLPVWQYKDHKLSNLQHNCTSIHCTLFTLFCRKPSPCSDTKNWWQLSHFYAAKMDLYIISTWTCGLWAHIYIRRFLIGRFHNKSIIRGIMANNRIQRNLTSQPTTVKTETQWK